MGRLLMVRLAWMPATFVVITGLTFAMAHLAPGDPLLLTDDEAGLARPADGVTADAERARPLLSRYVTWLARLARGDLGRSVVDRLPVTSKIEQALPRTLAVSGLALLVACVTAVLLGALLASRRDAWWARWLTASLGMASGVPSFWVAVMALLLLATPRGLELFPLQGLDGPAHFVLPVACLAWPSAAMLTRYVHSGLVKALDEDYVRAALARGLSERRVLFRHALPNALLPVITMVGLSLPHVFGGSVVIERVFGIAGMGLLAFEAIGTRDYPVVMGVAVVMAAVTLGSMVLADVLAMVIDPRVAESSRR